MSLGMPLANETTLVYRAQAGDQEAFGELVRRHRLGVIRVVYRMCGDELLAEDAAQIAFLRAWKHLPGFQPTTSFRNWLYRIAVNAAVDNLRREKYALDVAVVDPPAPGSNLEERMVDQERVGLVRKAVQALPPASRAVLVLREYEQLSYKEIAETLDISIGTVMSRLNYARNRLAEHLQGCLEAQ